MGIASNQKLSWGQSQPHKYSVDAKKPAVLWLNIKY